MKKILLALTTAALAFTSISSAQLVQTQHQHRRFCHREVVRVLPNGHQVKRLVCHLHRW